MYQQSGSSKSHQINMRNWQNAPNLMFDIRRYGYRRLGFKKWCQPFDRIFYEAKKWVGTLLATAMRGQQAPTSNNKF